ncbi:MAG: PepSY-associated TM helix domain-containing protein, partial [Bacteroidota bacterium]
TGEVQGQATLTFQRFFRDLHYFLFIPFQVGHFTVLIFAFMLLISMVTALLFYKKWWRKLFELKVGKGKLAFFRSLHRLVGLWSVPFALLFSITGIWYFAERTNLGGVSREANPSTPEITNLGLDSTVFARLPYDLDYDRVVKAAQQAIPGLQVRDISLPQNQETVLYLTGLSEVPLVRNRANRVYLHPLTYEVVGVQKAAEISTVTWLNDIADPLHFGYFGGILTKIIWFMGGMALSSLVLTGIWIALKRRLRQMRNSGEKPMGKWKSVNWVLVGLMLFFMYFFLIARYEATVTIVSVVTLILGGLFWLTWYVFVRRLGNLVEREQGSISNGKG